MRVAESEHHVAVATADILTLEGEAAEVTQPATGKCVFLFYDLKTRTVESLTTQLDQLVVRNRSVGFSGRGGLNSTQGFGINFVSSEYQ